VNQSPEFDEAISRLREAKGLPSSESELKRIEEFRLHQTSMIGEQA
jgi:hypothetical protein